MAQSIKLKRSAIAGRVPTTTNLDLGELAINVRDGKLYFKRDDSTIQTILTTNSIINGDLTMVGDITGSDVYIDDWGSISGSLANIQAGHLDLSDIQTVYATVKNVSGVTLLKGTPLAVVAGQTQGNVSDVVPADASDPALMPAVYILNEDLVTDTEGTAVIYGKITGIDTSAFSSGDTVYVAPGGGWTTTKPVHPNKIQNLGIITKSHASNGGGEVMGAGRSNDLPNLTTGKVWVGTATYPTESTTVHLDEANGRLGIGTTSPSDKLHIEGASTPTIKIVDTTNTTITELSSNNFDTYLANESSGRVFIRTGGSNGFVVSTIGNVGIGTTTPSQKLHVDGTIRIGADVDLSRYAGRLYTAQDIVLGAQNSEGASITVNASNTKNVLGVRRPSSGTTAILKVRDYSTQDVYVNIDSDGNADFAGNVGIGTASPSEKLHVLGKTIIQAPDGSNTALELRNPVNNDRGFRIISQATGSGASARFYIEGFGAGGILRSNMHWAPNSNLTYNLGFANEVWHTTYTQNVKGRSNTSEGELNLRSGTTSSPLTFGIDTTEYMRVHSNGNVGIGTTSPSHKLHVVNGSNTLFVTRDVGTAVRIGIGTANPSYGLELGTYTDGAIGGVKYLLFQSSSRIDGINSRMAYKANSGHFFYPTSANPSYDSYGVAIRHLRDSAANTNDDVLLVEQNDGTDLFKVKSSGNVEASGDIAATGAITSNGVDVLDNAVAMAIALG